MTAIPVVEDDGDVVGLIAVDDVLEQLIPEEWRWRAGAARD
jgi:Mg/Co/Ni transporter MgtE